MRKTPNIEKLLARELESIDKRLKIVEDAQEEPGAHEAISELGTFSWHLEVKETRRAVEDHLRTSREKIEESLQRLKSGMYGICEDCGEKIEEARLKIMPTATLCVECK